jgi:hypothetical protein
LLLLLTAGCAAATARETFAACRAADAALTLQIVHRGGAEVNPLMRSAIHAGAPVFVAFQLVVTALAWHYWSQLEDAGRGALNAISCVPAAYNLGQLR